MKRCSFFLVFLLLTGLGSMAQIYTGKTYEVRFFSDGPIEDISAVNRSAQAILNTAKNEIAVKVTIKGFDFEKKLMQEHFNQKYMESDKFPYATFGGRINDSIDFKKDGAYKVTVTGKLSIHGVEKANTLFGTVTVKGDEIDMDSKFMVALKDYNIEIPALVAQNISELIEVTVKLTLTEFKQK